jgi:hypothetical protein
MSFAGPQEAPQEKNNTYLQQNSRWQAFDF